MLAFHNSASLPAGTIGLTPGPALANVDSVDVTVRGVGSHGAAPQNGRDPIVVAAASSPPSRPWSAASATRSTRRW
jgi:hippurate hydrolase